jgi:hypothetical protein
MKKNLPRPLKLTLLVLMVCCAVLALTYLEALYLSLSNKKTAFTDFYYKGLFNVYTVDQCWSMDCYPTFRPLLYANRFNFEKLNDTYAKDNFSAFCDREIVWESSYPEHHPTRLAAHTGSFTALSRNYAKDTKNVFFWCDKIPEVDAASFSVISEYLSHDKNQFFFKQTPTQVPYSEDTEIFSLRGGDNGYILYSADQLTCFSHKHIPESMYDNRLAKSEVTTQKVAGSSFEYLGEGYSKDTDHLYFGCTVLETADTSQVLGQ